MVLLSCYSIFICSLCLVCVSVKGGNEMTRVLLTPEESDSVMPKLEEMFLNYQEEQGGM